MQKLSLSLNKDTHLLVVMHCLQKCFWLLAELTLEITFLLISIQLRD